MDMESNKINISEALDPWAYFYAVNNDTDSDRYYNWINAVKNITKEQVPPAEDSLVIILKQLRLVYTPLIILLGILGNTVTWLIMLKSRLRSLSSSHYLAATVMANSLYLVSLLIHWLSSFGLNTYNVPGWCQFVNFINSTSSFLSVWYLTAFAVDRYICICWPTESPRMCTRMRARVVIIILLCMGIVVYINISLTVGVIIYKSGPRCIPLPMFKRELRVLEVLDMFINLALPYLTIFILTILIIYNTCKVWHQRVLSENPAQIRNVTIVFLCMCLLFHLPNSLFHVVYTVRSLLQKDVSLALRWDYFIKSILQHLFHTSLAIHFILFVACYPVFAKTCKTPFNWLREKMLMKFRKSPNGDIHLRNVRFHAVQEENNVAHV